MPLDVETLFSNIRAEIEYRTTKTRQGCETGFRLRDRRLARIGKDVFDAIGGERREQRRGEPTRPTPDLENTQLAGAGNHLVQLPHHPGCYIVRPAEQRVGIIELLDRVEAPLGRNQIDRVDLRPQDPGKRRTVSCNQLQAREVSGIAGDRLAPETFRCRSSTNLGEAPLGLVVLRHPRAMGERKNFTEVMRLFGRDTPLRDKLRNSEPTVSESARQCLCGVGRSNAIEEHAGLFIALALTACRRTGSC